MATEPPVSGESRLMSNGWQHGDSDSQTSGVRVPRASGTSYVRPAVPRSDPAQSDAMRSGAGRPGPAGPDLPAADAGWPGADEQGRAGRDSSVRADLYQTDPRGSARVPSRDPWAAGQDFAGPWAGDNDLGGPRASGSGYWTPPGPPRGTRPIVTGKPTTSDAPASRSVRPDAGGQQRDGHPGAAGRDSNQAYLDDVGPWSQAVAHGAVDRPSGERMPAGRQEPGRLGGDWRAGQPEARARRGDDRRGGIRPPDEVASGDWAQGERFSGDRRSRDRRIAGRSRGRGKPLRDDAGSGDDDGYEWFRYLGEGRHGPATDNAAGSRGSAVGRQLARDGRPERSPEPSSGMPPARQVPGYLDSGEFPGYPNRRPGRTKDDYAQPLYTTGDFGTVPSPDVDPRIDSAEYASPLYPREDTGHGISSRPAELSGPSAGPRPAAPPRPADAPGLSAASRSSVGSRPADHPRQPVTSRPGVPLRPASASRPAGPPRFGRPGGDGDRDRGVETDGVGTPGRRRSAKSAGRTAEDRGEFTADTGDFARGTGEFAVDTDGLGGRPGHSSGAVTGHRHGGSSRKRSSRARSSEVSASGASTADFSGALTSGGQRVAGGAVSRGRQVRRAEVSERSASSQKKTRRYLTFGMFRIPLRAVFVSGSAMLAVIVTATVLLILPSPVHRISLPGRIDRFVRQSTVGSATARQLRQSITSRARGEVKNVVAAAYEQSTGPGTSKGPRIVIFIGGNLAGSVSGGSFINGFESQLRGSFSTSSGRLGGQAACAPGTNGGPAECAWEDDDTFGVVVSATFDARQLAAQMRQMRPQIEHRVR